jgi:hypothetical protein
MPRHFHRSPEAADAIRGRVHSANFEELATIGATRGLIRELSRMACGLDRGAVCPYDRYGNPYITVHPEAMMDAATACGRRGLLPQISRQFEVEKS